MGNNGVLLAREHLLAAAFADKQETGLHGINVKPDGTVEATNRHYAIRVPPCELPASDFPAVPGLGRAFDKPLMIPASACKDALKGLQNRRRAIPVLETAHVGGGESEETAILTTTDVVTNSPRTVRLLTKPFPNIDSVIPSEDNTITIGFNAQYLRDIADYALKVTREPCIAVTISNQGTEKMAARFTVSLRDARKAVIVLMPMKVRE